MGPESNLPTAIYVVKGHFEVADRVDASDPIIVLNHQKYLQYGQKVLIEWYRSDVASGGAHESSGFKAKSLDEVLPLAPYVDDSRREINVPRSEIGESVLGDLKVGRATLMVCYKNGFMFPLTLDKR
jgi:hypothetical protein